MDAAYFLLPVERVQDPTVIRKVLSALSSLISLDSQQDYIWDLGRLIRDDTELVREYLNITILRILLTEIEKKENYLLEATDYPDLNFELEDYLVEYKLDTRTIRPAVISIITNFLEHYSDDTTSSDLLDNSPSDDNNVRRSRKKSLLEKKTLSERQENLSEGIISGMNVLTVCCLIEITNIASSSNFVDENIDIGSYKFLRTSLGQIITFSTRTIL